MDYVIADHTLIPEHLRQYYTEKVIYLPHSYQINDDTRPRPKRLRSRAKYGLPTKGFVFCCFNNNYKITPEVFSVWMRVLKAVPGSVLWLLKDNDLAEENLRREAAARGVDPNRLVFAPRTSATEHLARQTLADLFLDTFPCNAHTTASDALWVGLPVLTCSGDSFASRVAASLLNAQGLEDLVCASLEEYEATAISLSSSPRLLKNLKMQCRRAVQRGSLFDSLSTTRAIESQYRAVHEDLYSPITSCSAQSAKA